MTKKKTKKEQEVTPKKDKHFIHMGDAMDYQDHVLEFKNNTKLELPKEFTFCHTSNRIAVYESDFCQTIITEVKCTTNFPVPTDRICVTLADLDDLNIDLPLEEIAENIHVQYIVRNSTLELIENGGSYFLILKSTDGSKYTEKLPLEQDFINELLERAQELSRVEIISTSGP